MFSKGDFWYRSGCFKKPHPQTHGSSHVSGGKQRFKNQQIDLESSSSSNRNVTSMALYKGMSKYSSSICIISFGTTLNHFKLLSPLLQKKGKTYAAFFEAL